MRCRCGLALLPYDRRLEADDNGPSLWIWLCPHDCGDVVQVLGDPTSVQIRASLQTWPSRGQTVATHISRPHDVYVGRDGHGHDGYFGNRITPGQPCRVCKKRHRLDQALLDCYGTDLRVRMAAEPGFRPRFHGLRGQRLACFCRKRGDEPCHAAYMAGVLDAACVPRRGLLAALAALGEMEPGPAQATLFG